MYEELPAKDKSGYDKEYEKLMEEWREKNKKWEEYKKNNFNCKKKEVR